MKKLTNLIKQLIQGKVKEKVGDFPNPPFHTIIFLGSKFFNPLEHLRLYKDFQSHEDVPRVFTPSKPLPDFRYCVLVHSQHISTSFSHAFKGEEVDSKLINDFI